VVRLAEFGAFVEILPGTDGLLHISEVAEHRIKDIKDELKEGDQILVKVLALEGNRIRLSRKAILREQRAKMAPASDGDGSPAPSPAAPSTVTLEGGGKFEETEGEPNFNRVEGPGGYHPGRPGGGGGGRRHGRGGRDRNRGGRGPRR